MITILAKRMCILRRITLQSGASWRTERRTVPVAHVGVQLRVAVALAVAFAGRGRGGGQHALATRVGNFLVTAHPVEGRIARARVGGVGTWTAVATCKQCVLCLSR